jgi:two-component system, OmpR family, sensor histidine kinase BaeS
VLGTGSGCVVISSPLRSSLAARLAAAFVLVALAAVVVLAGLTLLSARSEVTSLVRDVHEQDTRSTAAAASQAYLSAGGWDGADLTSPAAVAARGQAELTVRDADGTVIAAPAHEAAAMMAGMHGIALVDVPRGDPLTAPVMVNDRRVGTVELRFPTSHLPTPERQIRDALSRNAMVGAALAIATAVLVGMVVAQRVGTPITALTSAASRMQEGDRAVRVDVGQAPAEIATLASTFNHMAESIEREDELRRRLVADVAHELRTPLTILLATTEALVDDVAAPDHQTLSSLHDEVLRLSRLVGDLELLAAADAAGLNLDRRRLDLADVATTVVALARPAAESVELTIVEDPSPAPADGDPERLRQIVTTLVANSLAYTPPGGTITVHTGTDDHGAFVTVADTGRGIDDDDLPHVFDRFYRGRRTTDVAGSGIGLAVARELVHAHSGTITARNRPQGGTELRVTIPPIEPDRASS